MINRLDTELFKELLANAANNLTNQYQRIDALNVFPVPDGDTGTNMNLTFSAGTADCLKADSSHLGDLAKVLSKGLLMGARGNSGVILSQIFRGFFLAIEDKETITVAEFANAWSNGAKIAYKAVMRPVEGTILTVIRESSEAGKKIAAENSGIDFSEFMELFYQAMLISLENTPNLLPVLKEVGVVDSGGAGLCVIFEGMLKALKGESIVVGENTQVVSILASKIDHDEFGYCTEFIITLNDQSLRNFKENEFKNTLGQLGDSIVVVRDEDIVKVHVHTLKPGEVLNIAQKFGEFIKLKIENMQIQHDEILELAVKTPKKKYALIAVANGEGVESAFRELGVDYLITGGQTMNPATEDFVAAINRANADNILIFPNNSNIILAANQAASAFEKRRIKVLDTKTIPQGLSACIMFNQDLGIKQNIEEMNKAISNTKSASVTYAIKDTTFNGLSINENDFIGILEKNIVVTNPDKMQVAKELLQQLTKNEAEILTIIVGEGVTEEETREIREYIENSFTLEYELIQGNQPVYSFIFGLE